MQQEEVTTAIFEILAQKLNMAVEELKADLSQKGRDLPIDSLLGLELLMELEDKFSIQIPDDDATAASLGSGTALARRVCKVASVKRKVRVKI